MQKTLPGFSDHQGPRRSGWDGRPIQLPLTASQAGDAPIGRELLERLAPGGILPADKAYDTDAIRAEAEGRGTFAEVPPRVIRTLTFAFRPWLHRQRTQVERFFLPHQKLPGLTTRDEHRPETFRAAPKFADTRIWINAL